MDHDAEMLDSLLEFHFIVWPVAAAVCLDLSFQLGLAVFRNIVLSCRGFTPYQSN